MYVYEGYVYGSQPDSELIVIDARVVDDLCMLVTFSTGETRLLDATELLEFEAFKPLANKTVFEDFAVEYGVITWNDGSIDIAPEGLYRRTYEFDRAQTA